MRETVIILDFGGQYNQLIARRVRELNVYCEILPYHTALETIQQKNPKGIIFTGGPNSVYGENAPKCDSRIYQLGIPILGICYGSQLIALELGGSVETAPTGEYGKTEIQYDTQNVLLEGMEQRSICWMSHMDYISMVPNGFEILATTNSCPVAAYGNDQKKIYGFIWIRKDNYSDEEVNRIIEMQKHIRKRKSLSSILQFSKEGVRRQGRLDHGLLRHHCRRGNQEKSRR